MSTPNLSPLSIIEESVYQKVKDKHFEVWHYVVALALLTIVPTVLSSFFLPSGAAYWVLLIVVSLAWLTSRVIGRNLSRNKGIDSVLMYRYFAVTPWLIGAVATDIQLALTPLDDLTRLVYSGFFWISIAVSLLHIVGIIIHHFKNKRMIKNIKKDELFQ